MSVIVHGMEMPECCGYCPCAYWTEGALSDICQVEGFDIEPYYLAGRPEGCPLEEVMEDDMR